MRGGCEARYVRCIGELWRKTKDYVGVGSDEPPHSRWTEFADPRPQRSSTRQFVFAIAFRLVLLISTTIQFFTLNGFFIRMIAALVVVMWAVFLIQMLVHFGRHE